MSDIDINQVELWGEHGTIRDDMPPRQTVEDYLSTLPEALAQGSVFKIYVTCDVTYQIDYNAGIKLGAMTGLDTSAVPLSVEGAVKLARQTWRGMYEGFGEETRAIITQERNPAESPDKYPKAMEKLVTVFKVFWGKINPNAK